MQRSFVPVENRVFDGIARPKYFMTQRQGVSGGDGLYNNRHMELFAESQGIGKSLKIEA